MVPPNGEGLNSLFEVFHDWEHQLRAENVDFDALEQEWADKAEIGEPRP